MSQYEKNMDQLSNKEQDEYKDMKVVREMYARGFDFHQVDIYQADSSRFRIIDGKLMPALNTIEGMGGNAAETLAEAAKHGKFLSRDDIRRERRLMPRLWTSGGRVCLEICRNLTSYLFLTLHKEMINMRTFEKSTKLDNVCYDVRGPVVEEADRMIADGVHILKLNIGNPAAFGFTAPEEVIRDMMRNLPETEGYSDSKGLFPARKAIMQYCQLKKIPNVEIGDIYTGNGVSELITMSMQGLLNNGDEILMPSAGLFLCGRRRPTWPEAIGPLYVR